MRTVLFTFFLLSCLPSLLTAEEQTVRLRGRIVDAESGQILPARIYIRSADGEWHFPTSDHPDGSAV